MSGRRASAQEGTRRLDSLSTRVLFLVVLDPGRSYVRQAPSFKEQDGESREVVVEDACKHDLRGNIRLAVA